MESEPEQRAIMYVPTYKVYIEYIAARGSIYWSRLGEDVGEEQ